MLSRLRPWRRLLFFLALGISFLAIVFLPSPLAQRLETLLAPPLAVLLKAPSVAAAKARAPWLVLGRLFQADAENQRLKHDLTELKMKYTQLQDDYARLQKLHPEVNFGERNYHHLIAARLLARDPSTWFNYVTLDKGSSDGIVPGAGVIGDEGVVGKVASVTPLTCKVVYLIDPSCRIAVHDARSKVEATLVGSGRRSCHLLYLSGQDDIRPGDLIETAAEGTIFSKDMPVGYVMKVEKRDNGLSLWAEVKPLTQIALLEDFYIISGKE